MWVIVTTKNGKVCGVAGPYNTPDYAYRVRDIELAPTDKKYEYAFSVCEVDYITVRK